MRGDLVEKTAADVCRELAARRDSGILAIEGPGGPGRVVFADGRIIAAVSPTPRARLGDRLVGAGELDPDDLAGALQAQQEGGEAARLGSLLVERGLVRRDAVRVFVQEQVLDALFEIIRWRYGAFAFTESAQGEALGVPLTLAVDDALVEVARRQQEWDELSQVIPDLEAVPSFRTGAATASASLEPDEFAVLASVDGVRSVRSLAADLGYGEFEAARIVYGLSLLGIVDVRLPEDEIGAALEDALGLSFADPPGEPVGQEPPLLDESPEPATALDDGSPQPAAPDEGSPQPLAAPDEDEPDVWVGRGTHEHAGDEVSDEVSREDPVEPAASAEAHAFDHGRDDGSTESGRDHEDVPTDAGSDAVHAPEDSSSDDAWDDIDDGLMSAGGDAQIEPAISGEPAETDHRADEPVDPGHLADEASDTDKHSDAAPHDGASASDTAPSDADQHSDVAPHTDAAASDTDQHPDASQHPGAADSSLSEYDTDLDVEAAPPPPPPPPRPSQRGPDADHLADVADLADAASAGTDPEQDRDADPAPPAEPAAYTEPPGQPRPTRGGATSFAQLYDELAEDPPGRPAVAKTPTSEPAPTPPPVEQPSEASDQDASAPEETNAPAPRQRGDDNDVSEFLRELSRLSLDPPEESGPAKPKPPTPSPRPPGSSGSGSSSSDSDSSKKKRRGLFGRS